MSQRLNNIHEYLQLLADEQLEFIPRLIRTSRGTSLIQDDQFLWELTTWLPGSPDLSGDVSIERRRSTANALARVHLVWKKRARSRGSSPGLNDRMERLRRAQTQRLDFTEVIRSRSHREELGVEEASEIGSPEMMDLAERTLQHLSKSGIRLFQQMQTLNEPVDLHFVIRDLHSEHILYVEDQVTGVIDFGAARRDEPMLDLVRWLGSQAPFCRSSRWESLDYYLQRYQELSGAPFPMERSTFLERFSVLDQVSTLLSALQWFDWLFIERRRFAVPTQKIAHRWAQLVHRLDRSEW